ncbi:MAG: hypothetical protein ACRD2U_13800 [Terriglobales bacterium]
MTWADFYLMCFVVGLVFSVVSVIGGGSRWHLPHLSHTHVAIPHIPHAAGSTANRISGHNLSIGAAFNFATLAAFLAWFGGAGYLLTRYSGLWFVMGIVLSTLIGLAGAAIIFVFLCRVLTSEDENLDPADFEMTGVLGRASVSIRPGGTGEIIYSQQGTRRTCGARSESGAIAKGSEVVVTRYDKGIAYVRPWSEMAGEELEQPSEAVLPQPQQRKDIQ